MRAGISTVAVLFAVAFVATYVLTANLVMSGFSAFMVSFFHLCIRWILTELDPSSASL